MSLIPSTARPAKPSPRIAAARKGGARARHVKRAPFTGGHDLPVLAVTEDPRGHPAWDSLLERGVQPALILGAERRTHGPR